MPKLVYCRLSLWQVKRNTREHGLSPSAPAPAPAPAPPAKVTLEMTGKSVGLYTLHPVVDPFYRSLEKTPGYSTLVKFY
jgi:hypothetical protein